MLLPIYRSITKWDEGLLQNVSGFLLQNATVIMKYDFYYKMRWYSYITYEKKKKKKSSPHTFFGRHVSQILKSFCNGC